MKNINRNKNGYYHYCLHNHLLHLFKYSFRAVVEVVFFYQPNIILYTANNTFDRKITENPLFEFLGQMEEIISDGWTDRRRI